MQLFATFVKDKYSFFNYLLQQKLALLVTYSILKQWRIIHVRSYDAQTNTGACKLLEICKHAELQTVRVSEIYNQ